MKITIEFHTDNAAFGETEEDAIAEISRVLWTVKAQIERFHSVHSPSCVTIRDSNGNTIGTLTISPR